MLREFFKKRPALKNIGIGSLVLALAFGGPVIHNQIVHNKEELGENSHTLYWTTGPLGYNIYTHFRSGATSLMVFSNNPFAELKAYADLDGDLHAETVFVYDKIKHRLFHVLKDNDPSHVASYQDADSSLSDADKRYKKECYRQ